MKRISLATALVLLLAAWPLAAQAVDELAAAAYSQDALQLTPASPAATRSVVVDATPSFSVSLLAASRTLDVSLVAPNAVRYRVGDPDTATFQSGFFPIDATTTRPGASYLISIDNPLPGTWSLEVSDSTAITAPLDLLVTTFVNNGTRLVMAGGGDSFPSGSDVRLALVAFDGTAKVTPLSISAKMFRPFDAAFTPVAVTFRDDGTGADETAGDGIYEAFVNPGTSGNYQVQADVTGNASTGAFRRTAATEVHVVPHSAQITGFVDRGIDNNFDGLLDAVGVRPSATITAGGDYLVTVVLHGSNGRELQKSVSATFAAGTGSAEVVFPAADILRDLGVDGPYAVAEVRYYQNTGSDLVPADIRYDLGNTAAYSLGQLQHARLRLSGTGSASGVDFDGNGLYDRLNVGVGITADFAGFYTFSCSLTDSNGTELGFRSGSVFFGAGDSTLSLSFAGLPIGRNGVDGPYFISNLIMFGAGQSMTASTAFTTPAFRASQFEGFVLDNTPPVLALTVSPKVLWPVNHKLIEITVNASATDDRDPSPLVELVSITSSEGQNDRGDGNTAEDIVVDGGKIFLRAERSALDRDRIYTLTYRARDAAGNTSTASATVTVPHDQKK
jgi:hypothetical protein